MSLFFLGFLFTTATLIVDSPICIADDGGFYQELRKKKNPTQAEVKEIQARTLGEQRRIEVNKTSAKAKEISKLMDTDQSTFEDKDDGKDDPKDDDDPLKNMNVESQAEGEAILKNPNLAKATKVTAPSEAASPAPAIKGIKNTAPAYNSPAVKVDPGNLDELEFPGPAKIAPAPKKVIKKK